MFIEYILVRVLSKWDVGTSAISPLVDAILNLQRISIVREEETKKQTAASTRANATFGKGLYMFGNRTPSSFFELNHTSLMDC